MLLLYQPSELSRGIAEQGLAFTEKRNVEGPAATPTLETARDNNMQGQRSGIYDATHGAGRCTKPSR
jgi:hypothetical protein